MIPLKQAAKRNKPRAKSVTFREITPTKSQADDLAVIYLEVVRHWRDVSARILAVYDPPALTVDTAPEIEAELARAQTQASALIVALTPRVRRWTDLLALWHTRKWSANVQAATGVSIAVFLSSAAIADEMTASLAWNVSLIRNVSDQTRDRIANIVWSGWRERRPRRDVARELNEAIGLGRRRSINISVDQQTKLSRALDRSRRLEAGLDGFIWRSSHKVHFRPEHQARDGKRYTEKTAPNDRAGDLPFCGCVEVAYLDLSDS